MLYKETADTAAADRANHAKTLLTALALGALTLSGCSEGGGGVTASESKQSSVISAPSPTKTVPANGEHHRSVQSLKEAFVLAGAQCSGYSQTNVVKLAAESGSCGKGAVLSIYSSTADRDEVVANMKQFADMVGMNLLVGENWIINDKSVAAYQPKLGGTLVTRQPKK